MKIAETVDAFRSAASSAARPLGLVPAMGALHEGHRYLPGRARRENATAAASLFVNPGRLCRSSPSKGARRHREAARVTGNRRFRIAVMPGDGIGPEVMDAALAVLDAAAGAGFSLDYEHHVAGAEAYRTTGVAMSEDVSFFPFL